MTEKVLFVDDEPNVLEGIRRQLGRKVALEVATSGADGLRILQDAGPFAVVVSDMRMPGMSGSQFLAKVRELCPDTVRIILSGQSDMESTIAAVNEGQIYRFMIKPCAADLLWTVVESGLKQFRLVNAERDVLEKTLGGAVQMLTEVLGMTNPAAYSRSARIQRYAQAIAEALGVGTLWPLRLAGMLSQIGCITLPGELLTKIYAGGQLSDDERRLYDAHPEIGSKLLNSVPRLEPVAEIVAAQLQRPDLAGAPAMVDRWDTRRLGTMVLRTAIELEQLIARGSPPSVAVQKLTESWPELPGTVSDALRAIRLPAGEIVVRAIGLAELMPGMVLDEDLRSGNGIRVVPQGHEVTNTILLRLRSVAAGVGLKEPFRVRVLT
ncbi:MAG: HD domain-containing phosphohydrolase [Gammaproteobacteria bacterium]